MAGRSRQESIRKRVPLQDAAPAFSQPFASLAHLSASLPAGPAASRQPGSASACAPTAGPEAPKPSDPVTRAKKVVVRRERKGHGGKTATRIEGLVGSADELEALAKEWKRALGCGATVEGADILVQGEQGDRLAALLGARGAKKVVLGN